MKKPCQETQHFRLSDPKWAEIPKAYFRETKFEWQLFQAAILRKFFLKAKKELDYEIQKRI